jgi:hypothetical protein
MFTAVVRGTRMTWTLRTSGMSGSAVAAVIHTGSKGRVGPRAVWLCEPCPDPATGAASVPRATVAALLAGRAYVNVGTHRNPYGEIRGQTKRAG